MRGLRRTLVGHRAYGHITAQCLKCSLRRYVALRLNYFPKLPFYLQDASCQVERSHSQITAWRRPSASRFLRRNIIHAACRGYSRPQQRWYSASTWSNDLPSPHPKRSVARSSTWTVARPPFTSDPFHPSPHHRPPRPRINPEPTRPRRNRLGYSAVHLSLIHPRRVSALENGLTVHQHGIDTPCAHRQSQ